MKLTGLSHIPESCASSLSVNLGSIHCIARWEKDPTTNARDFPPCVCVSVCPGGEGG